MMNPLRAIGLRFFSQELKKSGPTLTFRRLCTSRHVDDLQSVASGAIVVMAAAAVFLIFVLGHFSEWKEGLVAGAGLFASSGAALGWAYQAGSRRLGAVDLFASEISVICRVCLIVDFAKTSIERARQASAPSANDNVITLPFAKFTSEERYTPVYDGNISDLQPLDFDVVTEVTRFYTYRKTMMDLLRRIAQVPSGSERSTLLTQMIYMQYLMYESARLAIKKLIEFEPYQSECVTIILCSEYEVYSYLRESYDDTFQERKLSLRFETYQEEFEDLKRRIHKERDDPGNWLQARATAPEMTKRFEQMCWRVRSLDNDPKKAA